MKLYLAHNLLDIPHMLVYLFIYLFIYLFRYLFIYLFIDICFHINFVILRPFSKITYTFVLFFST